MNPFAFAFMAWLLLGFDLGVGEALRIGSVQPSFAFALVVAVALNAQNGAALWGAIVLGFFVDLVLSPVKTMDGHVATIVGPHAIGFLIATHFALSIRRLMNRRNPLSYGVLAVLGSVIAQAMVVAFLTFHKLSGDSIEWEAGKQLLLRLSGALYTGALATLLSLAIIPLSNFLGFPSQKERRFGTRGG